MARQQRTKLTLKDIGEPSKVKTSDQKQIHMGRLVGIAEKFVERKSADGEDTYQGLSGQFRIIPADKALEELESGVLFIPDAFHNMCAGSLRDVQKDDPNATTSFAFDIYSIKANNPAGYSWGFTPVIESKIANPLEALTAQLPPVGKTLSLEGPKAGARK